MKYFRPGNSPTNSTPEIKTEETEDFLEQKIPAETSCGLQTSGEGGGQGQEGEEGGHREAREDLGLRCHSLRD